MKKCVLAILMGALMALCLAACGGQASSSAASASGSSASASASSASASASSASASASSASASASSASASAAAEIPAQPTEAELKTIIVNDADRSVTVWGQINGTYFTNPTHHFLVNKDGKNGEKCVLRAWATPDEVYEALVKLGGKPGDNLKFTDEDKGKFIEGDKIEITVNWNGAKAPAKYADCLKRLDGSAYEADMRFGGNKQANLDNGTGCISCTFSCPLGIISNAKYAYASEDVTANPDVLPADGTFCQVTYKLV